MPISLGPISNIIYTSEANGSFRLGGEAFGQGVSFDGGFASLGMFMSLDAQGYTVGDGVTPEIPGSASLNMAFGGDGIGFDFQYGEVDGSIGTFGGHAYSGTGAFSSEGFMDAGFRFGGYAEELAGEQNYGFFVDRSAVVMGVSGIDYEFLDESVHLEQVQRGNATAVLTELARLRSPATATYTGLGAAADHISFGDRLAVVARVLLQEGFAFTADADAQRTAMERVIDGLLLAGVVQTELEAISAVVAAVSFIDLSQLADQQDVTDGIAVSADVQASMTAAARLVDSVLMAGPVQDMVRFVAVLSDQVALADDIGSTAQLMNLLQEGVSFAMHIEIEDGRYSAYVINTESKGVTQYSNYPFNSFAKLGGRYFGMTPDGIRELEGDTDDGAKIGARFRLAMTNLGTGNHKRMIAAYLGYTSTGELRVKAITVDRSSGKKRADYYRLRSQPAGNPVPGRVKIGQGLLSVYWGFEVEAIDGAAFAIDLLDLHPIMVNIRVHGQGGGTR